MQIHVATGKGNGPTTLSAFDAALNDAGIANYNLLVLSSVIPPKSEIVLHEGTIDHKIMPGTWGDRLYVVMAEQQVEQLNEEAWAGVGWVQEKESGKGLFVEHEGNNEETVRRDIESSLKALMITRGVDFGEINMKVAGVRCDGTPACAMVVAVYQASDWDNNAHHIEASNG